MLASQSAGTSAASRHDDLKDPKDSTAVDTTAIESGLENKHATDSANAMMTPADPPAETPPKRITFRTFFTKEGFLRTICNKHLWIILVLGQILSLGTTATNTFTTELQMAGVSIPAFQSFFNYVLLLLVYTPFTMYRYGFKGWLRMVWRQGWKYIIFAFCDVEGNYFIVLAYDYTTILSAQLINFWAIAMVVLVSFFLLRVRYHWAQIVGILVCIGGMGVLLASDHITGSDGSGNIARNKQIKGDMFALVGATFYGLSNVTEEYFVSKQPMYEVLGQLGLYGMIINGVQCAIFDRHSFQNAHWNAKAGGWLAGYTLALTLFYSLAPLLFRLASAAFFNISILTSNFWGVIVAVQAFHLTIHFLYPIAFVLIIIGQVIYFIGRQVFGSEALKPWLGRNQEKGVVGIGTARRGRPAPDVETAGAAAAQASDGRPDLGTDDARAPDAKQGAISETETGVFRVA